MQFKITLNTATERHQHHVAATLLLYNQTQQYPVTYSAALPSSSPSGYSPTVPYVMWQVRTLTGGWHFWTEITSVLVVFWSVITHQT